MILINLVRKLSIESVSAAQSCRAGWYEKTIVYAKTEGIEVEAVVAYFKIYHGILLRRPKKTRNKSQRSVFFL
jgi:hypothetical protein